MKRFEIPSLEELLEPENKPESFPFNKTYEEAKNDPLCVLHTSGSTGMPKPIIMPHSYPAAADHHIHMPPLDGRPSISAYLAQASRRYIGFPPWHAGGLFVVGLTLGVYGEMIQVFGPRSLPPSSNLFLDIIEYANIDTAFVTPAQLEPLPSFSKEALEKLRRLKSVGCAGGLYMEDWTCVNVSLTVYRSIE